MMRPLAIGIDVGTSGIRALAIDTEQQVRGWASCPLPDPECLNGRQEQTPAIWWEALLSTLTQLATRLPPGFSPASAALDGTSGSLLLTTRDGRPLGTALMYADQRADKEAELIARVAPAESAAHGKSSALAKLLWLIRHRSPPADFLATHQADWLIMMLGAPPGTSDENNALKLGYDPVARCWPDWISSLQVPSHSLPDTYSPGTPIGTIRPSVARSTGLPSGLKLVAGTTDSVAAFIATGAREPGEGVTSLGSTLVLKLISRSPVFQPVSGIYSHRLGDLWLAGGASNSGGAVLRKYFSDEEIARYTQALRPDEPTGLNYYPLLQAGERFPLSDSDYPPRLTPRPVNPSTFFQGMLEGMADIEHLGYQYLQQLTGEQLLSVRTAGGGAANAGWTRIRGQRLGVRLITPEHQDAAYGSALLALGAL